MKKGCENLTDEKSVVIDCGKEVKRDGEFNMFINLTLLSIAMDAMNDTNRLCLTQTRVIEELETGRQT